MRDEDIQRTMATCLENLKDNEAARHKIWTREMLHYRGAYIERALIVDEPWLSMIIYGMKSWEMRTTRTKIRGRIGLIRKGTGLIVGTADLVDSLYEQSAGSMLMHQDLHRIKHFRKPEFRKWRFPWVLKNTTYFKEPIPYKHPQGAVIWVKI